MKLLIPVFLFLVTFHLSSQEVINPEIEKYQKSKWSVGVNYSQNYCYRFYLTDKETLKDIIEIYDGYQLPDFGYNTGINVLYKLTEKLSFESGIKLHVNGERTKYSDSLRWPEGGTDPKYENLLRTKFHLRDQFFEVPLKVNYYFKRSKVSFFGSGGIIPTYIFCNKSTTYLYFTDRTEIRKSKSYWRGGNNISLTLSLSAGMDIDLFNDFILRIEPSFRSVIFPLNDFDIKRYDYSGGLNLGFFYNL